MSKGRKVTVRGVIYQDGLVFAQRLITDQGVNKFWSIPGGKLDPGESLTDGLSREMIEETGVEPDIGNLLLVHQFQHKDYDYIEFFYHLKNTTDYHLVDIVNTTHGVEEVAEFGFVDPSKVELRPSGIAQIDLQKLIATSKSVPLLNNTIDS